jgi:hypothetical protein
VSDQHGMAEDIELVRTQLHQLVDDVEPSGDSLARLLSAARRRRSPRRPLFALAAVAVTVCAVYVAAVLLPFPPKQSPSPVSVAPNSYVAQPEPGVVASFDVLSGHQLREIARVPGSEPGDLAVDGQYVDTLVAAGGRREIVQISPDGTKNTVAVLPEGAPGTPLASSGGRIAYTDRDAVVVLHDRKQQRVPVPSGARVVDLALNVDGRLAVLTVPAGNASGGGNIYVAQPGAVSMTAQPAMSGHPCGSQAIAWVGPSLAVLHPVDCTSGMVRIATYEGTSGEQLAAGVAFSAGRLEAGQVRLSVDQLHRFLVSGAGNRQWLIDGSNARTVPLPCSREGCGTGPGAFSS